MVGGNYPPGMSKRDFVRAGIDQPHSHKCEFEDAQESPIFEDGAAIFSKYCMYSEGEYGEKYQCDKKVYERVELDRIIKKRDGEPNIAYLVSEENPQEDRYIERVFESVLANVSMNSSANILDLDPPSKYVDGFVHVEIDEFQLIYK